MCRWTATLDYRSLVVIRAPFEAAVGSDLKLELSCCRHWSVAAAAAAAAAAAVAAAVVAAAVVAAAVCFAVASSVSADLVPLLLV